MHTDVLTFLMSFKMPDHSEGFLKQPSPVILPLVPNKSSVMQCKRQSFREFPSDKPFIVSLLLFLFSRNLVIFTFRQQTVQTV